MERDDEGQEKVKHDMDWLHDLTGKMVYFEESASTARRHEEELALMWESMGKEMQRLDDVCSSVKPMIEENVRRDEVDTCLIRDMVLLKRDQQKQQVLLVCVTISVVFMALVFAVRFA